MSTERLKTDEQSILFNLKELDFSGKERRFMLTNKIYKISKSKFNKKENSELEKKNQKNNTNDSISQSFIGNFPFEDINILEVFKNNENSIDLDSIMSIINLIRINRDLILRIAMKKWSNKKFKKIEIYFEEKNKNIDSQFLKQNKLVGNDKLINLLSNFPKEDPKILLYNGKNLNNIGNLKNNQDIFKNIKEDCFNFSLGNNPIKNDKTMVESENCKESYYSRKNSEKIEKIENFTFSPSKGQNITEESKKILIFKKNNKIK